MVNLSDVVKALNIAWVNCYCKAPDSHWCTLLDHMVQKVGEAFLFQCNYKLKLLDLKNVRAIYKYVLAVWQELNSRDPIDAKEIQQEILWNNRFIMISGKSIYYKTWVNKGILKVFNLLDTQGQFLCCEDFNKSHSQPTLSREKIKNHYSLQIHVFLLKILAEQV